jgi:hypothetical protein
MVATLTKGYCSIANLVEYNLNVNWNDSCFKPILAMELKTSCKNAVVVQPKETKEQRAGWH